MAWQLTGNEIGSSNTIILDIDGTPQFDLPDTEIYEGEEIDSIKENVEQTMESYLSTAE